jgi:hypothetical protein
LKKIESGECEIAHQGSKAYQSGAKRDPSHQSRKTICEKEQNCKSYDIGSKQTREKRKRKRKERKPDQDRATTAK